jgi:hypothetical protein
VNHISFDGFCLYSGCLVRESTWAASLRQNDAAC